MTWENHLPQGTENAVKPPSASEMLKTLKWNISREGDLSFHFHSSLKRIWLSALRQYRWICQRQNVELSLYRHLDDTVQALSRHIVFFCHSVNIQNGCMVLKTLWATRKWTTFQLWLLKRRWIGGGIHRQTDNFTVSLLQLGCTVRHNVLISPLCARCANGSRYATSRFYNWGKYTRKQITAQRDVHLRQTNSGIRLRVAAKILPPMWDHGPNWQQLEAVRWVAEGNGITSRLSLIRQKHLIPAKSQRNTIGRERALSLFYSLVVFFYSTPELAVMQRAARQTLISRAAFGSAGRIYGNWERWGFPLMDRET